MAVLELLNTELTVDQPDACSICSFTHMISSEGTDGVGSFLRSYQTMLHLLEYAALGMMCICLGAGCMPSLVLHLSKPSTAQAFADVLQRSLFTQI